MWKNKYRQPKEKIAPLAETVWTTVRLLSATNGRCPPLAWLQTLEFGDGRLTVGIVYTKVAGISSILFGVTVAGGRWYMVLAMRAVCCSDLRAKVRTKVSPSQRESGTHQSYKKIAPIQSTPSAGPADCSRSTPANQYPNAACETKNRARPSTCTAAGLLAFQESSLDFLSKGRLSSTDFRDGGHSETLMA